MLSKLVSLKPLRGVPNSGDDLNFYYSSAIGARKFSDLLRLLMKDCSLNSTMSSYGRTVGELCIDSSPSLMSSLTATISASSPSSPSIEFVLETTRLRLDSLESVGVMISSFYSAM